MKTAISEITTYPAPLEADLAAYSAAGFRAVELSLEKTGRFLMDHPVEALQELLSKHRLIASGAISLAPVGPALLLSGGDQLADYLTKLRSELALCAALGIGVLGVGADAVRWATGPGWQARAVENLRKAASLAENHGVHLALEFMSLGEPIGPFVLDSLAGTLDLVGEAGHPALGISIDFFHHFRAGGTVEELKRLDAALIANVHVTDVRAGPAPSLDDRDRVLPGQGVAPIHAYRNAILAAGYQEYRTLELLNADLWQVDVAEAAELSARAMESFNVRAGDAK